MEIVIEQLEAFSPHAALEFNNLLKQLDANSRALSDEDVRKIIDGPTNRIFIARETAGNKIVGTITLVVVNNFSAKKGLIEDLVVDENYQRKGIGTKLINTAINQARKERIERIDFTSNPTRVEANKLYAKLGFKIRNTNVYRLDI